MAKTIKIPEGYEARIEGNKVILERKESEFEIKMKKIRALYIAMQEQGVDDRYGDALSANLPEMIKWLTDKIELAKREREFSKAVHSVPENLTPFENAVLKMIDDIAKCITYPNDSCIPNVRTIASELLSLAHEQFIKDGYVIEKKAFRDAVENYDTAVMKEVSDNVDKMLEKEQKESEDERIRKDIIAYMRYERKSTKEEIEKRFIPWLEKQKEQKPVQDRKEREYVRTLKSLIADFLRDKEDVNRGYYQDIYDWLDGRHIEQKPAEWSEEDKECRNELIQYIENRIGDGTTGQPLWKKWHSWLKSLRPSWKPSEEQMEALFSALQETRPGWLFNRQLTSLYDDLKKI